MNFNSTIFKSFRLFLFPFSIIYGLIVIIRNYLFDKNILKSVSFDLPIITVGNLSAGGTGKTPMVEYLLELLEDKYKLATLSRGYKRKTKGYVLANAATTAQETGDEPMQFHCKFPDVAVAVGEERITAIPNLLYDRPKTNVIILDDAFQHRSVKPGLNILLTDYSALFTRDFFLPSGNLRDQKTSYKRAEIIVVTKCPFDLSQEESNQIKKEIKPLLHQKVFFATTGYGHLYHIFSTIEKKVTLSDEILLVCGIANPAPLKNYLSQKAKKIQQLSFSDHHIFTDNDIKAIKKTFNTILTDKKIIITTEKDAVRLMMFSKELTNLPLFVLPVRHRFLFNQNIEFDTTINTFIENFSERKKIEYE